MGLMKENDKEELKKRVLTFLMEHDLAVFATSSLNGQPEAATMGYIVDSDFSFSFLTKDNSRKVGNILSNPLVAIVVGTTSDKNTIQIEGQARILHSGEKEYENLMIQIAGMKSLYYSPLLRSADPNFVVIAVKTTWLRWLDLNTQTGEEEFFQLIS